MEDILLETFSSKTHCILKVYTNMKDTIRNTTQNEDMYACSSKSQSCIKYTFCMMFLEMFYYNSKNCKSLQKIN